jgi:gliding motility-associated-like protein
VFDFIDLLPETINNQVTIFDRLGNVLVEISNYNNSSRVFTGIDRNGNELPAGSYFFRVVFSSGKESQTGFISLRR